MSWKFGAGKGNYQILEKVRINLNKEAREIEFDLLENGLNFILSSLDPIVQTDNETQLKYSILHLSAGVELVLKERLRQEHWSLLFENINSANSANLSSGDFQSVGLEVALGRLENICGVHINDRDRKYLRELKKRRNRIEHFAFKEIDVAIKSLASKVLSTIFTFIQEHLEDHSLTDRSKNQIEILRKKVKDFSEFTSLRVAQIKDELDAVKKEYDVIKCPGCYQDAFVMSDDLNCLFCGYHDSPENVAESYIENILGISRYLEIKDGGYDPLEDCPDCGALSLVDDGESFICFTCLSRWSRGQVSECSGCARLYFPDDKEDMGMCDSCLTYTYEKWDKEK